jgi:hypothetical protein
MDAMSVRDTYMLFLASSFSTRELGAWLVGPYRAVAPRHDDWAPESASTTRRRVVRDDEVVSVVEGARKEVCIMVGMLLAGDDAFIDVLMAAGALEEVDGEVEARDVPALRLAERVLSLVVVDYLSSPESFRACWAGAKAKTDPPEAPPQLARLTLLRRASA